MKTIIDSIEASLFTELIIDKVYNKVEQPKKKEEGEKEILKFP